MAVWQIEILTKLHLQKDLLCLISILALLRLSMEKFSVSKVVRLGSHKRVPATYLTNFLAILAVLRLFLTIVVIFLQLCCNS